jgi:Ricin-type beta-trefoil lectin domain
MGVVIMFRKRFHLIAVALVAMGLGLWPSMPAQAAIGEVYGPYLYIDAGSTNLCINDPGPSTGDVTMIVYPCQGTASNERWDNETAVTTSDYWTFNEYSHKCLTVLNASKDLNAPIIQYSCNSGLNERWEYDPIPCAGTCARSGSRTFGGVTYNPVGLFMIKNLNSGKCITIKNSTHTSNQPLLQWTCGAPGSADIWEQYAPA